MGVDMGRRWDVLGSLQWFCFFNFLKIFLCIFFLCLIIKVMVWWPRSRRKINPALTKVLETISIVIIIKINLSLYCLNRDDLCFLRNWLLTIMIFLIIWWPVFYPLLLSSNTHPFSHLLNGAVRNFHTKYRNALVCQAREGRHSFTIAKLKFFYVNTCSLV